VSYWVQFLCQNVLWEVKWVEASWNVVAHAQKPDFIFRWNGQVHLNQQGRQRSRPLAAKVCASAVVMLDTPRSEVVWRVLTTHCIRQFPLHFPSRASPCAITFQLESTSLLIVNEQVHLYRWGRQFSRLLAAEVRISGNNAGYTTFRGSVKGTGYPLHSPVSPSLPLLCVTVCRHISTGYYNSALSHNTACGMHSEVHPMVGGNNERKLSSRNLSNHEVRFQTCVFKRQNQTRLCMIILY